MKGTCHTWSRGRQFSPSLPGDRYLKLGSKSDLRAEISGSIVWYDALAPRPEVLLPFSAFYANNVFWVLSLFCTVSQTAFLNRFPSHFSPCCPAISLRNLNFSKLKKFTKMSSRKSCHFYNMGSFFEPLFAQNNCKVVRELTFYVFATLKFCPNRDILYSITIMLLKSFFCMFLAR